MPQSLAVDVAALVISVVAVILAGLSFAWTIGWSIWQHRATTRPRLGVQGSFAIAVTDHGPADRVFTVRALNEGSVPATVMLMSAQIEGVADHVIFNNFLSQEPQTIPCHLGPGEHWQALIDAEMFRTGVEFAAGTVPPPWQARAVVKDASGRFYYGEWLTVPASFDEGASA